MSAITQSAAQPAPERRPFQFRIRTLLLSVAAVCALLATAVKIGPTWSMVIFWSGLMIAAHVVGTKLGHQLRDARGPNARLPDKPCEVPIQQRVAYAPETQLRGTHGIGSLPIVITSVCATVGGIAGTLAIGSLCLDKAGYAGVMLGSISTAIISGFLGFLSSTFFRVSGRAMRQAADILRRDC